MRRREISRSPQVRRGRQWTRPLSPLEHVSPIEWDIIVRYGQYILDLKLVRQRRPEKWVALAYKITRICTLISDLPGPVQHPQGAC